MEKLLYSKREAANYLAMSERKLDMLRMANKIAARKDGKSIVFLKSELDDYALGLENA
jgi:excisionase family DNA binding protein